MNFDSKIAVLHSPYKLNKILTVVGDSSRDIILDCSTYHAKRALKDGARTIDLCECGLSCTVYQTNFNIIIMVDCDILILPENSSGLFSGITCRSLELRNIDTARVKNMSKMFTKFNGQLYGLEHFDTRRVTDMSEMFKGACIDELDISAFDTRRVTDMSEMFRDCIVNTFNAHGFSTINVRYMNSAFRSFECKQVVDLKAFDLRKCVSARNLFKDCNCRKVDLTDWVLPRKLDMKNALSGCEAEIIGGSELKRRFYLYKILRFILGF